MPSDPRIVAVLDALAEPIAAYRAALAATAQRVGGYLEAHRTGDSQRVERFAAELGPFGAERLDVQRFAALSANSGPPDPMTLEVVDRAHRTLLALGAQGDLLTWELEPGGDLRAAVAAGLARIGLGFAAASLVELARAHRPWTEQQLQSLDAFPFRRWSKPQRRQAPPVVVSLDGDDLAPESLAEFLDGCVKIVLVVRGASPPASLVRLITPGTFVLQSGDGSALARLVAWEGPGVGALVSESAAWFVHDPARGPQPHDRLEIIRVPEQEPRVPAAGRSVPQQVEELRQLRALAERPVVAAGAGASPAPAAAEPADRLAAWLLGQTNLGDLG